jgi:four helix bundle protein
MDKNFENLDVWKSAREIRNNISSLVRHFPLEEKYRLSGQLIRAARAVTANIAEGHGRYHYQENIQFCRVARGSMSEVLDHLICANDNNYITEHDLKSLRTKITLNLKMLNGYIAYLKKRKEE